MKELILRVTCNSCGDIPVNAHVAAELPANLPSTEQFEVTLWYMGASYTGYLCTDCRKGILDTFVRADRYVGARSDYTPECPE